VGSKLSTETKQCWFTPIPRCPHQLSGPPDPRAARPADERPRQPACIHLLNGPGRSRQSDLRPTRSAGPAIAARLQDMGFCRPVRAVGLSAGLGLHYGFLGCLYAGCTVVPTYPPLATACSSASKLSPLMPGASLTTLGRGSVPGHDGKRKKNGQAAIPLSLSWLAPTRFPTAWPALQNRPSLRHAGHAPIHLRLDQPPKGVMSVHANSWPTSAPSIGFPAYSPGQHVSGCPCTMTWG